MKVLLDADSRASCTPERVDPSEAGNPERVDPSEAGFAERIVARENRETRGLVAIDAHRRLPAVSPSVA